MKTPLRKHHKWKTSHHFTEMRLAAYFLQDSRGIFKPWFTVLLGIMLFSGPVEERTSWLSSELGAVTFIIVNEIHNVSNLHGVLTMLRFQEAKKLNYPVRGKVNTAKMQHSDTNLSPNIFSELWPIPEEQLTICQILRVILTESKPLVSCAS